MYEFTTDTKGYRGYIGSRAYASGNFPQYVQNLIIRTYCQKHGLTYLLSATEYAMPHCYMMLDEVINNIDSLEGAVLFSVFMLPEDAASRHQVYQRVLSKGKSLHAALEDLSIKNEADVQMVEDILRLNRIVMDDASLAGFVQNEVSSLHAAICV